MPRKTAAKEDKTIWNNFVQLIAMIPDQYKLPAVIVLLPCMFLMVARAVGTSLGKEHITYLIISSFFISLAIVLTWYLTSKTNPGQQHGKSQLTSVSQVTAQEQSSLKKIDYSGSTIQVFLPDWTKGTRDEFYQDGAVQRQAFTCAWKDSDHVVGRLHVEYQPMTEGMTAEDLLSSMKKLYLQNNAIYFLMTMSSKVQCVSKAFGQWHAQCKRNGDKLPVLISTVASAPDLANAEEGILRWYVRSQEESTLLAQYLRWEKKVAHVGIFYVTHREGEPVSRYGTTGKDIFKEVFNHLGGKTLHYPVTADNAAQKVQQWLFADTQNISDSNKGAFVIGYGGMMKRTLEALIKKYDKNKFEYTFSGPIACSSTLTRKDWQPNDFSHDENIYTVLPRLKGSEEHLEEAYRDVVFFFSKETLNRVIEITNQDPDAQTFIERWKKGTYHIPTHMPQLCEEHLSNGDTIISLEVVDSGLWRVRINEVGAHSGGRAEGLL